MAERLSERLAERLSWFKLPPLNQDTACLNRLQIALEPLHTRDLN